MNTTTPWIAVVDDEQPVCRSLMRLLRSEGLEARAFSSGVEFLAYLPGNQPACVVIDINMPLMSGLDVCERLAEFNQDMPVILMTGHDSMETRVKAFSLRPFSYLTKPMDANVLLDAIDLAIEQTRMQRPSPGFGHQ